VKNFLRLVSTKTDASGAFRVKISAPGNRLIVATYSDVGDVPAIFAYSQITVSRRSEVSVTLDFVPGLCGN